MGDQRFKPLSTPLLHYISALCALRSHPLVSTPAGPTHSERPASALLHPSDLSSTAQSIVPRSCDLPYQPQLKCGLVICPSYNPYSSF